MTTRSYTPYHFARHLNRRTSEDPMNDTSFVDFKNKILIPLLTAITIGLFGWVWKTTAEIAIWQTLRENTEERIQSLEKGIEDRFTRTQAEKLLKELEDRLQKNIDSNHEEQHEAVVHFGIHLNEENKRLVDHIDEEIDEIESQMGDNYKRLDDRLRALEKTPPASL